MNTFTVFMVEYKAKKTINGYAQLVLPRVIYGRVQNRKNYYEIPAFLPIERGISRAGKFKVTCTEMCLFLFSFEIPALEVPHSKFKMAAISK